MIPDPKFDEFEVTSDCLDLVAGRALFTDIQIDGGSSWIAHYNIHNYGLLRHQKARISEHILGKVQEAKEDPHNKIVILIGDFNIAAAPPSPVNPALYVPLGEGYSTWRATQDAICSSSKRLYCVQCDWWVLSIRLYSSQARGRSL